MQLIWAFVFAFAKSSLSHDAAQIIMNELTFFIIQQV